MNSATNHIQPICTSIHHWTQIWAFYPFLNILTYWTTLTKEKNKKNTLLRVVKTMT